MLPSYMATVERVAGTLATAQQCCQLLLALVLNGLCCTDTSCVATTGRGGGDGWDKVHHDYVNLSSNVKRGK